MGNQRIEDYALIGDTNTAALVSREGSIDWLCAPRFDSAACFASLLGDAGNGYWAIHPVVQTRRLSRRYRGETLVLETEFVTREGTARVIDFMPPERRLPRIVRIVEGVSGQVRMGMELAVRFDYGSRVPWVHRVGRGIEFTAGPDALRLDFAGVDITPRGLRHEADFVISEGQRIPFALSWHPSHERRPPWVDTQTLLTATERWWATWATVCQAPEEWREPVVRSLIVLKALTYGPTGGIVAAPTTSLPEDPGGVRNWDYRICWLRDATFTLYALMMNGYISEARSWRDWLLRAIAGQPELMQIMYGPAGESRLTELELPWLAGFRDSKPVRVGNEAAAQYQLDVYGEVMDSMYLAGRSGVPPNPTAWGLQKHLMRALSERWSEPDQGIWEVRGPKRHFTHSKVMAWVAVDRAVRSVERLGLEGPLREWKRLREEIHSEVCEKGYDPDRGAFTWYYGSKSLDAALLMMPLVGFLPAKDPRVRNTLAAIEQDLVVDGFVKRYRAEAASRVDGLAGGEGTFLPCTFWLADNLVLQNRRREARSLFRRLLGIRNDVGLLSEEYDPKERAMLGNFPQAFTHVSLVNTAHNLSSTRGPAHDRRAAR
ncbi:MAG: glycoside hydrolase family 15 protein [Actinobacteria bacterium]|nr:glycoside hydrolase family 15 protein [Actinomycetota bacterium]